MKEDHHMCGIAGGFGLTDTKILIERSLWSVRHRGKGSIGIAGLDFERRSISVAKKVDYADHVFDEPNFQELTGQAFIGHVRWPTQGAKSSRNAQPHYTQGTAGRIAVASNGDLINIPEMRQLLDREKIRIYSDNDAEILSGVIYYFIEKKSLSVIQAIREMMGLVKGSFSAVFMADFDRALYAFRDPYGIRPLLLGVLENRYFLASETCQFDVIGATLLREVAPGEILRISDDGLESYPSLVPGISYPCAFEKVYFQRPDSTYLCQTDSRTISNYLIRQNLGRAVAREFNHSIDVVLPSPRSGIPAAIGFAAELGVPYEEGIITDGKSIGRTFIESDASLRARKAGEKYNLIRDVISSKRVAIVDDSAIRFLTVKTLVSLARFNGASEVHFVSASPCYLHPCPYGVETKRKHDLTARDKAPEEMRIIAGSPNSLSFLSLQSFREVIGTYAPSSCLACFDGEYPIK